MEDIRIKEELIKIVKEDSTKATGCTEPVAVAYSANVGAGYIDTEKLEEIRVRVSKNIYKNGKAVKIPNTDLCGLDLAASLGVFTKECQSPFSVFSKLKESEIQKAKEFIALGKVFVEYIDDVVDIYISTELISKDSKVKVIITGSHSYIRKIIKNDKVLVDNGPLDLGKTSMSIKSMSFKELADIVRYMDYDDIKFTLEGVDINIEAANEGLKGYGLNLGKKLNELKEKGMLPNNFITDTRILTAAAADMRMGGGTLPIMTSGGSGNQGIGVTIPVYIVAKEENLDNDTLARGLFFAHVVNRYVKEYSGKLSGICGCAIGAGIGASAAIAFMLGGNEEQISGACINIYANLTGMLCDGAKESCSIKLSTSSEEAILAAYLSLNGMITNSDVGIVGDSVEDTILNIGRLSHEGFSKVDDLMLEIIEG